MSTRRRRKARPGPKRRYNTPVSTGRGSHHERRPGGWIRQAKEPIRVRHTPTLDDYDGNVREDW